MATILMEALMQLNEEVAAEVKEMKLSEFTKITSAEQAKELCKGCKWCFASDDAVKGKHYFDAYAKQGELYFCDKGDKKYCALISDGKVKMIADENDNVVKDIVINLEESCCKEEEGEVCPECGKNPCECEKEDDTLTEAMLNETLDNVYKKYWENKMKRAKFDEIIRLDPTFDESEDKLGSYGIWLLSSYGKKRITDRDLPRALEILTDFHDRKRYLRGEENQIQHYKNLDEIRAALDNIVLTQNQIAALNRKAKHHTDLGEEAEFIAENDKWEIWRPLTYNASTKLGSGTTWCTASTSSDTWFHHYADNGALYIFIDKTEDNHKIQLHIDRNGRCTDFKDGHTDSAWARGEEFEGYPKFIIDENLVDLLKDTPVAKCDAWSYMINLKRLEDGEPYLYDGTRIANGLKSHIKEVVFSDKFNLEELPDGAFRGCTELKKLTLPDCVMLLGSRCFKGCPDDIKIGYHVRGDLQIRCYQEEMEFYSGHLVDSETGELIYK